MQIKKILSMIIVLFLFSFCSASLGIFKQSECVNLMVQCDNCTYVNITSISYPNSTYALLGQYATTENGGDYNYSFCSTGTLGTYKYSACGNDDGMYVCVSDDFEVTYNGFELTTESSLLYLGFLFILICFLVGIIILIYQLPSRDTFNDDGELLGINNLKYLRPVLWSVVWGLLMGIMFITSNVSIAYLPQNMYGEFFFMIWKIMLSLTLPMIVIMFLFIFVSLFRDKEYKRLMERGVPIKF